MLKGVKFTLLSVSRLVTTVASSGNGSSTPHLTSPSGTPTGTSNIYVLSRLPPNMFLGIRLGCNRVGKFMPAPENGKLAFVPFDKTNSTDTTECGKACLLRNTCRSFDYNKSTSECCFFTHTFADDCTQFIRDPNVQHFDLQSSEVA